MLQLLMKETVCVTILPTNLLMTIAREQPSRICTVKGHLCVDSGAIMNHQTAQRPGCTRDAHDAHLKCAKPCPNDESCAHPAGAVLTLQMYIRHCCSVSACLHGPPALTVWTRRA